MGGKKGRAGRPKLYAAQLKLGDATRTLLVGCMKKGNWKRFDDIAAAFVRFSFRLEDKAPLPKGVDETNEEIIRGELKKTGAYVSIFPENSPEIEEKSGGNSPEIEEKSGGNSPEIEEKSGGNSPEIEDRSARGNQNNRFGELSPSPSPKNSISPQDEEDAFSDLWEAYPRKTARDAARREFHRALVEDGVAPATILNAVMAQSRSAEWAEDGGRFVPRLDNWLRDGRWADVLSVPDAIPEKNMAAPPAQPDPFEYRGPRDPQEIAEEMRNYEAELAKRQQAEASDA